MSSSAPPHSAAALEAALRHVLGEALTTEGAAFAVEGLTPQFVAAPASSEELAAVLQVAAALEAAVIPWGGGQHMALGNMPARYDVALRTSALDRVLEYEPTDMTITVEAGITFKRLQAVLREHGQFLPIDAPPEATVGGALAVGVSGPSRHAYGLPRDWLIGCRVAHVDGSVAKGGGRVVKNVAGYDMPKLAAGSLGTLGVTIEATLKVAPLPAAQEAFLAAHESLEDAAQAVFDADERGLALRTVALLDGDSSAAWLPDGPCIAAYWLAGPSSAVERTARELGARAVGETRRLEGDASERWRAELSSRRTPARGASLRAMLLPSHVAEFMLHVRQLASAGRLAVTSVAYPTTGLVLLTADVAPVEGFVELTRSARRWAEEAGGSLVVEAAPPEVKRAIDVWGEPGSSFDLMKQLKQQFDPSGTLNPGRYVGGI